MSSPLSVLPQIHPFCFLCLSSLFMSFIKLLYIYIFFFSDFDVYVLLFFLIYFLLGAFSFEGCSVGVEPKTNFPLCGTIKFMLNLEITQKHGYWITRLNRRVYLMPILVFFHFFLQYLHNFNAVYGFIIVIKISLFNLYCLSSASVSKTLVFLKVFKIKASLKYFILEENVYIFYVFNILATFTMLYFYYFDIITIFFIFLYYVNAFCVFIHF